jgi:hypothetical protein
MKTKMLLSAVTVLAITLLAFNWSTDLPEGWFAAGSHPKDYDMGKDSKTTHSGKASAYVHSNKESIGGFGTLMQMVQADKFLGQRVRMIGYIKAENVTGWAGMWMRVDGKADKTKSLSFDNMQNRSITGTTDWKKCEIVLDVPAESSAIAFGVLLNGTGKVWFDDVSFEKVDWPFQVRI